MGNGHLQARFYPLGMLEDEALLVIERVNAQTVTEASILQLAVGSILDKKAGKAFEKRLKKLSIETKPRSQEEESLQWPPPGHVVTDNGWVPPEVED